MIVSLAFCTSLKRLLFIFSCENDCGSKLYVRLSVTGDTEVNEKTFERFVVFEMFKFEETNPEIFAYPFDLVSLNWTPAPVKAFI